MPEEASASPAAADAPSSVAAVKNFLGLDLGVLNVVVSSSTAAEPSAVSVATNDVSNRATPAAVAFDGSLRLVGDSADAKLTQLPKQVINAIPAVLGGAEKARASWSRLGCQWPLSPDSMVGPLSFGGREDLTLHPSACLAAMLRKIVSFVAGNSVLDPKAEALDQEFEAAISVPDVWGEAELSSLRAAVDILGWRPERIHVLPTSATLASAYAQRVGQKLHADETRRVVAFVDVGFSQSSISVAAFTPPPEGAESPDLVVEVLSCASAPELGTQSFCQCLAGHVNEKVKQMGREAVPLASKRGARLMLALQKVLKELSMLPDTTLALECFFPDEGDLKLDISRALFEDATQKLLQELVAKAGKAVAAAGLAPEAVHSAELVGGGMRIPRVQQLLSEFFPEVNAEVLEDASPTDTATTSIKGLSSRLRFGLDGASGIATGAAHYAAGHRNCKTPWDLCTQKSSISSEDDLRAAKELECWMLTKHLEEVSRLEKQNELESFIYEVRGWLNGPDRSLLKPDITEPILEEASRWFEDVQYDDSTTVDVYEERLRGLKRQLEDHGTEYFEKKRREKEAKEKELDEQAEKERQRRQELGMDADKDDRKMAKSERIKMATKNKEEGNTVLKAGNLEDAAARYQRALQHLKKFFLLDYSPEEKAEADAVGLSVHLNLAQVYLKLAGQAEKDKAEGFYQKAKASADEALAIDAGNVKAKFRKGTALEKLGDIDAAAVEVASALKIDPENADLVKFKDRLDKLQAAQKAKQKKMYGKMFG